MQPKVETKVNPKSSFSGSECVSVGGKNYEEELCMCMTLMVVSSGYTTVLKVSLHKKPYHGGTRTPVPKSSLLGKNKNQLVIRAREEEKRGAATSPPPSHTH